MKLVVVVKAYTNFSLILELLTHSEYFLVFGLLAQDWTRPFLPDSYFRSQMGHKAQIPAANWRVLHSYKLFGLILNVSNLSAGSAGYSRWPYGKRAVSVLMQAEFRWPDSKVDDENK